MNFLNKNIPIIVVSSSSFIFLLFLITIFFQIELIVSMMFVVPITVVSSTGMVLSYKNQVADDEMLIAKLKSFPNKYKHYLDRASEVGPSESKSMRIPLKGIPKEIKRPLKKKPKKKKGDKLEPAIPPLTPKELEEIKQTEKEVGVEEQKFTCIVHKGPIKGKLFLCPHCNSLYCNKCATALKEKGEKCWSCEQELVAKQITPEMQKRISSLNSLISHYKIRMNTLDHRVRAQQMDRVEYLEEKEKLMVHLNRYTDSLNKLKKSLDLE